MASQNKNLGEPPDAAPRGFHSECGPGMTGVLYALKELPQPQVDLTFGLLNLKPAPSSVST